MSDNTASLRHKIAGAGELQSVVRTMKALAASSIGQYEKSVRALGDYQRTVESGLSVCFRQNQANAAFALSSATGARASIVAVVFGSDQGLVGQFNEQIVDFALQAVAELPQPVRVWAVGERAAARIADAGQALAGQFVVPNSVQAIVPLVGQILGKTCGHDGEVANTELHLFHNRPTAGASFEPVQYRLLPLDDVWRHKLAELPWATGALPEVIGDAWATLRALIRDFLFISIFRACAESLASENASRLAAMQRADQNIDELLEQLHSTFHRVRQGSIDEELFDVISGFEALSARSL